MMRILAVAVLMLAACKKEEPKTEAKQLPGPITNPTNQVERTVGGYQSGLEKAQDVTKKANAATEANEQQHEDLQKAAE